MSSTQITLRNAPSSPELARRLQEKCERLGRIHPDIHHCRVSVTGPEPGAPATGYCVTLRVVLPDGEIAPDTECHEQVGVAINRAFSAARLRLEQLVQAARPSPRPRTRNPMEARK